jgi:hypothetical protein
MFFCISLNQVMTCLTPTMGSLRFPCLRRERERREQLHRILATVSFDQFIVVIINAVDRLTRLIVTKMRPQGQNETHVQRAEQQGLSVLPLQAVNTVG